MRGGRGRGRFGRGSVTLDLVRDNMEDLGIDHKQLIADAKPPSLFPPIAMQGPSMITEEDRFLIQKMREINHKLQISPYYITRKKEETDIDRYSNRQMKKPSATTGLLELMDTNKEEMAKYIPYEILDINMYNAAAKVGMKRKLDEASLLKLEQQEKDGGGGAENTGTIQASRNEGSDVEGEDDDAEAEAEFELDADYGVDHYASDNDYSGDDAEATF